jgi:hypothetical protein
MAPANSFLAHLFYNIRIVRTSSFLYRRRRGGKPGLQRLVTDGEQALSILLIRCTIYKIFRGLLHGRRGMKNFFAAFTVTYERSCPFYKVGDGFVLTGQSVRLPAGCAACLILVREFTSLLFVLARHGDGDSGGPGGESYSCGGCTGLIKYQIVDSPAGPKPGEHDFAAERNREMDSEKERKNRAIVSGGLDGISPLELLQFFHMHQKTGKLLLQVPGGPGRVAFREGAVIGARFAEKEGKEAIFSLLGEHKGRFSFMPGIPASLTEVEEIGDFMMLLMEGIKRLDEQKSGKKPAG